MNNLERVAEIFGGKAALSRACGVSKALVTRWSRKGEVPSDYHTRVKREAWFILANETPHKAAQMEKTLYECLQIHKCPTCGREYNP